MITLTAELRELFQLILPLRIYFEGFLVSLILFYGKASCLGILDELLSIFRLDSCQNGEEVFTITDSTLCILVREVLGHLGHLKEGTVRKGQRQKSHHTWVDCSSPHLWPSTASSLLLESASEMAQSSCYMVERNTAYIKRSVQIITRYLQLLPKVLIEAGLAFEAAH